MQMMQYARTDAMYMPTPRQAAPISDGLAVKGSSLSFGAGTDSGGGSAGPRDHWDYEAAGHSPPCRALGWPCALLPLPPWHITRRHSPLPSTIFPAKNLLYLCKLFSQDSSPL